MVLVTQVIRLMPVLEYGKPPE